MAILNTLVEAEIKGGQTAGKFTKKLNRSKKGAVRETAYSVRVKDERKRTSVEKRLEQFYGKPIEEIGVIEEEEVDWGNPVGEEVW